MELSYPGPARACLDPFSRSLAVSRCLGVLQLLGLLEARGGMRVRLRSARLENEFPGEEEVLPDGTTETVFVHWELQETPMTEKKAKRFLRDSKCDFILLRRKQ